MNPETEVEAMTDKQADTMRNDLIDLIIELVRRIDDRDALIQALEALKH